LFSSHRSDQGIDQFVSRNEAGRAFAVANAQLSGLASIGQESVGERDGQKPVIYRGFRRSPD
jgi:hypothetical protein